MPWKIVSKDGEFCIFKEDEAGEPMGETLGCHPTEEKAKAQLAALYASEQKEYGGFLMPDGINLEKVIAATKVGARHNQRDARGLQDIHDAAITLGAACPPQVQDEIVSFPLGNYDNLMFFGGAVKALGDGKVGGYLVRFSNEDDPDLTGDFFNADTDYGEHEGGTVYYQHGLDPQLKTRKLSKSSHRVDEFGVWCETQLKLRDDYEKFIYSMAEAGKLAWSSGTAPHLVEREQHGKAMWIKTWPLGLDDSLTPTPAEPRNEVIPLKSYMGAIHPTEAEAEGAGDAPPVVEGAAENIQPTIIKEPEMELTQEQLDAVVAQAGKAGADAAIKSLPTINSAGVQVIHDEADTPFSTIGEQLLAVKNATLTQGRELAPRLKALNIKALGANELVGSEGGFLLEPSFIAGLLAPMHDTGPFSSRVDKMTIGPNANGVTVRAIDETDRATGSRLGWYPGLSPG